MAKQIACCGLNCSECPTYLATQNNDDAAREKVAAHWKKQFQMNLTAADINCDGCLSNSGRIFMHCRTCEIKKCATAKGLANCAPCNDYACEKLQAFHTFVPHAKSGLEAIRKELGL